MTMHERLVDVINNLEHAPIGGFTVIELATLMKYHAYVQDANVVSGPRGALLEERVEPDLLRLERMAFSVSRS